MFTRRLIQPLLWLWASPTTVLAAGIAALAMPTGVRIKIRQGVIECHGGLIQWILNQLPVPALAMTLGHVIWGQTAAALDITREHEHVHVRQYERWGPFFIPAYLLASAWLKWNGRNAYYENPFEREAFEWVRRRELQDFDPQT